MELVEDFIRRGIGGRHGDGDGVESNVSITGTEV